ncbi:MAG: sodium-independent anion transporter [Gammaproteobacteria bacterium 28-57-27]|nr:MAG: sodium-independent anion transporter [Gammaproteobacteria bacterium 28-57-27]
MFHLLASHTPKNAHADVLSGLTVALALVPEAVAFALVAQLHPLMGLYAAFMVALITSSFGGRPGMISAAAGSLAVVMVALVVQHGPQYLLAAVVLMGIIQIAAGLFKLGKFIRIVPYPVFLGFVNGLAIVILLAQFEQFKITTPDGGHEWISGMALYIMLGLIALTMLIAHVLPRFTKAVPSTLVAIVVVSLLAFVFSLDTRTVGDMASIAGGLPDFSIPQVPLTLEALWIVLPYAFVFAGVGLIESLLTLQLVDDITETRGQPNRECVALGAANITSGFFGGMGGCALVGQSIINVESGGRGRLSGITAALVLLMFILFLAPVIEQIPLAALVGVMFMVVIGTFEWGTLHMIGRVPRNEILISIMVAVITVVADLALAVITGVIVSALLFAWDHAKHIRVETEQLADGSKLYRLIGPLFFASAQNFAELFDLKNDPQHVVIDFARSRVADQSALEAIDNLAEKYRAAGKALHLRHLASDCRELLRRAGDLVEVNIKEDPLYHVAEGDSSKS